MNRNRLIVILLLLALSLGAAGVQALAQQPGSQSNDAIGSPSPGDEIPFSKLLARAHQKRRLFFSLMPEISSPNLTGHMFSITPAAAPSPPVTGSGTFGRLTKWGGFTSANSAIVDSNIYEDKFGKVGLGTDSPTSKLTVAGLIESKGLEGGVKFPDGTVQTTAAIATNQVVKSLNGLMGDVTLTPGANITLTPSGNTLTIAAANTLTIVQPVQIQLREVSGEESFVVPDGKRLVIEHVSGFLISNNGSDRVAVSLSTTVSGLSFFHTVVFETATLGGGGTNFYVDKPVRLYADPASVVSATFFSASQMRLVLSGHFVAVP